VQVLNIEISPQRLSQWVEWLAPERQPFFVTAKQAAGWELILDDTEPDRQQRDTYRSYNIDATLRTAWLDETAFYALPRQTRARLVRAQVTHERAAVPTVRAWRKVLGLVVKEQADGHRFVWWQSLLRDRAEAVLPVIVTEGLQPSRHASVDKSTWAKAARLLPHARELSGTFPVGSGPNCFGTVMAAAGVDGAADAWMQRRPFDEWLADNTSRGGRDDVPGTVFVWRDSGREVQHAAVTLGNGWMLHKPSQAWMTPRKVRTVAEVVRSSRTTGWHLHRYAIHP